MKKLIIIPAYNESSNIVNTIRTIESDARILTISLLMIAQRIIRSNMSKTGVQCYFFAH